MTDDIEATVRHCCQAGDAQAALDIIANSALSVEDEAKLILIVGKHGLLMRAHYTHTDLVKRVGNYLKAKKHAPSTKQ